MSLLQIRANPNFTFDVVVRESDKYSESVYLKFERSTDKGEICRCDEIFLTPAQLDQLGCFLIRRASEIASAQENRD